MVSSTYLKALVWFWWIYETLSANLFYQSDYEIGGTTPSDEEMVKITMMVMTWWWSNAWTQNEEREKQKAQGKGISSRSHFVLVIETLSMFYHR